MGSRRECETLWNTLFIFASLRVSLARCPRGHLTQNVSRKLRKSRQELAPVGRSPAGWSLPASRVSDLTVAAQGQLGWEHSPHKHDLSGLIFPPRAGGRTLTSMPLSTSHRGENSEKGVFRCGVGGGEGVPDFSQTR